MLETLILAFDGTATYSFARSEAHAFSVFGGPMECKITGKRFAPYRLHHIARLSDTHLPVLGLSDLPLVYGMCYSGCNLTYQFEDNDITVLDLSPKRPTDDWPYKDYPPILPYVPVAVRKRKKQSWRQFAAGFPNMKDVQPNDLVVVVPPPLTVGVSLWGREGDAEGVAIVFECDLDAKKVVVYNVCS
jgi:hypothetical protein